MPPSIREIRRLTQAELSSLPITKEATIGDEFLDSNGHMNVLWYFQLFNQASGGMHKWLGFDWRKLRAGGRSSFVLEGHIRYLAEALEGERLTMRTRLVDRSANRMQYVHFMFNDDRQVLAATYEEVLAHIDMNTRRMAPFPDDIAEHLDQVLVEHQALPWAGPVCGAMRV